ncbi:MAG TPA: tetratricopeptide repeat protein [Thermoanaerobaculia bacterium]|nr:tetratricopeptide repeat protein [Thermoanaerobaculia bacterium]
MTKRWIAGAAVAATMAFWLTATVSGKEKDKEKSAQPFFHQFLIAGDPLDERLLEQEKRVNEHPDSPALRNDFGNLLVERRFPKEARAEYKKALKLDPHFFLAAYNLGMLEEIQGRVSQAISAYQQAIKIRPGFPPAHFRLGRLYEKQGRDDDAIPEYAKALRINSALRDPRYNPLIIDSTLIDRASMLNYPTDVARAAFPRQAEYTEVIRFRTVAVDRPLNAEEVVEEAGPQTIETSKSAPPAPNRAPPMPTPSRSTGTARPAFPRPAPAPAAPPATGQPAPTPAPEPEE